MASHANQNLNQSKLKSFLKKERNEAKETWMNTRTTPLPSHQPTSANLSVSRVSIHIHIRGTHPGGMHPSQKCGWDRCGVVWATKLSWSTDSLPFSGWWQFGSVSQICLKSDFPWSYTPVHHNPAEFMGHQNVKWSGTKQALLHIQIQENMKLNHFIVEVKVKRLSTQKFPVFGNYEWWAYFDFRLKSEGWEKSQKTQHLGKVDKKLALGSNALTHFLLSVTRMTNFSEWSRTEWETSLVVVEVASFL